MIGDRIEAWSRSHRPAVDLIVTAALLVVTAVFALSVHAPAEHFLFSGLLLLPLAVRRSRPALCLLLVAVVALAQWLTVRDTVGALPADVAVLLAVHAAAAYGPRWARGVGLGAGLVGAVLGGVAWPQLVDTLVAHVAIGSALAAAVVAAWAVGTLHRIRQAAERELAVLAERQRIAREMHDVVAHSLAVVIAQADGGRYVPGNAVAALGAISAHARQALGETRRILGVLRADQQSLEPALGLADLATLVDGLEASLTMDDLEVEPGVGLAAYRIVQEGLTNVLKHAGPGARAEVTVRRTAGWLEILVADDGRGPGDGAGGLGLIGMRERAAAYGGSVELTARAGGGSLLMARMSL